jgi:hypothetical protein
VGVAQVRLWPRRISGEEGPWLVGAILRTTDPAGRVRLSRTSDGAPALLLASRVDLGSTCRVLGPGEHEEIEVVLGGPAPSVSGRVTDEAGRPLSVWVSATPADEWNAAGLHRSVRSDSDGRYEITGLARGVRWILGSHRPRGNAAEPPLTARTEALDLCPGSVVDLRLLPR